MLVETKRPFVSEEPNNSEEAGEVASTKQVEEAEAPAVPAEHPNKNLKWYVINTYSGFEAQAKKSLEERVKREGLEFSFGEVMVPQEEIVEVVKGKKRSSKRKFFPSYMLVQMELNDKAWHLVKNTPKVTGFVGNQQNPQPIRQAEMEKLVAQLTQGAISVKPRIEFESGENVRVTEGPFASFNGVVEDVNEDKQKLRVLVSIFGRATPVELDFQQVEKVAT
jgi:transcriptional antiterminator NusG